MRKGPVLQVSATGIRFIAGHELPGGRLAKKHLRPYDDGAGIETIGIGHRNVEGLTSITESQAWTLFRSDLQWVEGRLTRAFERLRLPPHKVDALADFLFNVGWTAFQGSPVHQAVLDHDLESSYVPSAMHLYTRGGGRRLAALVNRRTACEMLWFFAEYKPYNRGTAL